MPEYKVTEELAGGAWIAKVWCRVSPARDWIILWSTRVHASQDCAKTCAEKWLERHKETGSWNDATETANRNYW